MTIVISLEAGPHESFHLENPRQLCNCVRFGVDGRDTKPREVIDVLVSKKGQRRDNN